MQTPRIAAAFLCSILYGTAYAQSEAQDFYRACLVDATREYDYCRHAAGNIRECRWEYRHEKDRCWNAYINIGKHDPYYGGSSAGAARFEPVPIPQRPVYILPGMK